MSDDALRLEVACPSCGKPYRVKRELAGKTAKCGCGAKLVIPTAAAPAAPSQKLTTELVLPPDATTSETSDDEYEIEAPVVRPVPEAIRRTVEQAAKQSSRQAGGAIPPRVVNETRPTVNGLSRSGWILLTLIALIIVAGLVSLEATQRVVNSAHAFAAAFQPYSEPGVRSRRAELDQATGALGLVSMVNLMLPAVAFVSYLIWLYAKHSRLKAMGVANLRFTPGWAIGYQFVPFWNLIRPYQIMREIWHGSEPGEGVNDCSRGSVRSSWLICFWWVVALVLAFSGLPLLLMTLEVTRSLPPRPNVQQATAATIGAMRIQQAGVLLIIIYNVLLGLVVRSIERRQATRLIALNSAS